MSIEAIKNRLHQLLPTTEYKITDNKDESFKWAMNYQNDVQFLLEQNHRLKEKLDESRKEWREMFSKSSNVLLALYTLNLCCPDPETMEFEWEDGKEDYIDALNKARSLL